jgi:hypothetical protein
MTAEALVHPQAGARPPNAAQRGAGWAALRPRLPQPDFLRPVARPGALAWAWLATGLLVLGAAGLEAREAWLDREQALLRLDGARHRIAAAAAAPARPAADLPAPSAERAAQARRWLARLARPWPAVWAANENAAAEAGAIRWLGFELNEAGQLRLSGLAGDALMPQAATEALRLQQHLGDALWRDVVLAGIERVPEGQRFEILARLVDRPDATPTPAPGAARPDALALRPQATAYTARDTRAD